MSGSFKDTDTVIQGVLLLDEDTRDPISGLTDIVAKILKPDLTVLDAARALTEVAGLSGIYIFASMAGERDQDGVYLWQVSSATGNFEQPVSGKFESGILTAGVSGGGSEAVTVKVIDSITTDPIPDAKCSIFDSTGTVLQRLGITGGDGFVILIGNSSSGFSLDPGDYTVRLSKAMVNFEEEYQITVEEGGGNDFVLEGTVLSIPPPVDPDVVRVYGNIKDLGLMLRDIEQVELRFSVAKAPQKSGDIIITATPFVLNKNTGTAGTDGLYFDTATGDFWIDIVRGVWVQVCCTISSIDDAEFLAPDQATAKLIDLIPSIFTV